MTSNRQPQLAARNCLLALLGASARTTLRYPEGVRTVPLLEIAMSPAPMSPFPNRPILERWRELATRVHDEQNPERRAEMLREMDHLLHLAVISRKRPRSAAGTHLGAA